MESVARAVNRKVVEAVRGKGEVLKQEDSSAMVAGLWTRYQTKLWTGVYLAQPRRPT